MNNYTEILNRHSKEITGNDFKMLLRLTPNKTHTEIIIDIVTRAMEEVEKSKTPKIKLKELREKWYTENDPELMTEGEIFDWFVTELKLKEDSK